MIFRTLCGLIILLTALVSSQEYTADEILKKVDENLTVDGKIIVSKMIIHGRRGKRTVEAKTFQRNITDSFTEYLAPARDRGTKMLKLDDRLWTYSPDTDRTILISGHMLRQSVMGSDLSYEDMMEDPLLHNLYSAEIAGNDTLNERAVWIVELTAKKEDVAYQRRTLWVDKERFVPLKENQYAKSGKLLKQIDVREVTYVDGRWIAKSALFKDVLKAGDGTEFVIETIEFNADIPGHVFSKASLRR